MLTATRSRTSLAPARIDGLLLLLLAMLALVLLWPVLLGGRVLYYRDLALVFEPQWRFVRQSLQAGQMPLWNPLLAGGFPHWASMEPSFLYPLHAVFLYFAFAPALAWLIFLHLCLAGCGTYALGRLLGWRCPAAVIAAILTA